MKMDPQPSRMTELAKAGWSSGVSSRPRSAKRGDNSLLRGAGVDVPQNPHRHVFRAIPDVVEFHESCTLRLLDHPLNTDWNPLGKARPRQREGQFILARARLH